MVMLSSGIAVRAALTYGMTRHLQIQLSLSNRFDSSQKHSTFCCATVNSLHDAAFPDSALFGLKSSYFNLSRFVSVHIETITCYWKTHSMTGSCDVSENCTASIIPQNSSTSLFCCTDRIFPLFLLSLSASAVPVSLTGDQSCPSAGKPRQVAETVLELNDTLRWHVCGRRRGFNVKVNSGMKRSALLGTQSGPLRAAGICPTVRLH